MYANIGDPRSAASGLGLHCLPMSHKKYARLMCVNVTLLATGMGDVTQDTT